MTSLELPTPRTEFDPLDFAIVQKKTFEELRVGDIFRAPSRTLTDAHSSAFQTVSADNHPVHYDAVWAKAHGHSAPVVHGLQVLAFTGLSCEFTAEVHSGDTLYSQLVISSLEPRDGKGFVTTDVTVHNQRGDVVLRGTHEYTLKLTPA